MKKKLVGWLLCVSLIAESLQGTTAVWVSASEQPGTCELSLLEQTGDLMEEEAEQISLEEAEQLDEKFAFLQKSESASYSIQESDVNAIFTTAYGYEQLDLTQRKCYDVLVALAERFHQEFPETVSKVNNSNQTVYLWETVDLSSYGWTDITDFRKVLFALGADYPQYFWYTCNFSYAINQNKLITKAYLNVHEDYASTASRKTAWKNIETGMEEYITEIDKAVENSASELELELLIHDKIIENIDYKYSSGTTPSDEGSAHSITGVFDKTGVVCEGYAKAFQLLANYAGLESIYAVGYGNGGGHAWNLINIDGEWYNLDVTWDDLNKNATAQRQMVYTWFNCSTSKFAKHSYQPSVYPGMYDVPNTTADTYNYYTYYNLYVTQDDVNSSEKISKLLGKALEKAKENKNFHLQFSCENSTVMSSLLTGLSVGLVSQLSDAGSFYYTDGSASYSSTNGYYVYKNILCAYLPQTITYYDKTAAIVPVYFYDGKEKKELEGNYSLSYSDNEQVGVASVLFQGIGDYSKVGSYTFKYTVEDADKAPTNTVTPTKIPSPTSTVTPMPTATKVPSNTAVPSVTKSPSNTAVPSVTKTPTNTAVPSVTKTPTNTAVPSVTKTPTNTAVPSVTKSPTNTAVPSVTKTPTNTAVPSVTKTPTNTAVPSVTKTPTNTAVPSVTKTPTNTAVPSVTKSPTNTAVPSVTKSVANTWIPTKVPTPTKKAVISYQVFYRGNGGKIENKSTYSVAKKKNETLSQLPEAVREGYVFLGWYTKKTGGSKVSKSFKVTRNSTLYAHWLKIPEKTKVTLKQNKAGRVNISWKKIKGVSYYKIYVSDTQNGTYRLLKKTRQTSYTDKNRTKGKRYYYYVKSYSVYGKTVSSSQSAKKNIKIK